MLNDDIRHVVTEGISVLVETMDRAEDELVVGNGPILTANHLTTSWYMVIGIGSFMAYDSRQEFHPDITRPRGIYVHKYNHHYCE